jgi:hypothetical protein
VLVRIAGGGAGAAGAAGAGGGRDAASSVCGGV